MGKALYRAYRSRSFDDVVGQEHITTTLKNAIASGRISHAYLFTGPRGVGKTSVARILAHEVNNLEYKDDEVHLDIIEIDAASNRRIDEIRDLRDKVHIAPTSAKYKVYIIDEVHMLTREAFNALLKTLEEPPAHCIFILATTESHKVPETIISRTQRFNFKSIEAGPASRRLKEIADKEGIKITEEALSLLAEHGEGSFRDSLSMLDQLGDPKTEIDAAKVRAILGLPAQSSIDELINLVETGQSQKVLDELNQLYEKAVSPNLIAQQISRTIRQSVVDEGLHPWQLSLLKNLIGVSDSNDNQSSLELALLEASSRGRTELRQVSSGIKQLEVAQRPIASEVPTTDSSPIFKDIKTEPVEQQPASTNSGTGFSLDDWPAVVNRVKSEAASVYTALRLATPKIDGHQLILSFQFPLHQKKVNNLRAKDIIGRIIQELTGSKITIDCVVEKNQAVTKPNKVEVDITQPDTEVQSISNIFGGGEVLESEALS
jgi:DNA polymerase III subunit gamma/tau